MKLLADKRVRQYELTYLLPVSLTTDEVRGVQEKIGSLVKKHHGSIVATEDWGTKTLAYKIKHKGKAQTEASYTHLVLEFDASHVTAFEQEFKHEPLVLRYLMVIAEKTSEKGQDTSA